MAAARAKLHADRGQRRASFQRAKSRETKRALVQAAMALWRTQGYAPTTVADICTAAGVSKALFYFYFPRKEDVLFEVGVLSTQSAHRTIHDLLDKPYEIEPVLCAALTAFERSMARNPRDLIIETILEGYRQEHRILAEGTAADAETDMFTEFLTDTSAGSWSSKSHEDKVYEITRQYPNLSFQDIDAIIKRQQKLRGIS